MKYLLFLSVILFSCKKDQPAPVDKNVTVKAAVFMEMGTDGYTHWKPGIIFNKGITATGTVKVEWYVGGSYGHPYATYSKVLNFTVKPNNNGYFEIADSRPLDPLINHDSARIKSFTLTSGDYNVAVDNN